MISLREFIQEYFNCCVMFVLQEAEGSMNESPAASSEATVMEEPFPMKHEPPADPVPVTEKIFSFPEEAPLSVFATKDHAEPNQAQSECRVKEENILKSETLLIAEGRLIQKPCTEIPAIDSEAVQSSPVEGVGLSDEVTDQGVASAAEAQPAITVSEEEETQTADDVLINADLKANSVTASESATLEETSSPEQQKTDTIPLVAIATEETSIAKLPVAVEEPVSLEPTERSLLDVLSATGQAFSDLILDSSLDLDKDVSEALKPVAVWEDEQEQEEKTAEPPAEMEDELEVARLPEAEPEGSHDTAEAKVAEQEAGSEGSRDLAEELEETINHEVNCGFIY